MSLEKYKHCRVCGKYLNKANRSWALQRFEQQTCSTECRRREDVKRHGCCDQATHSPCVCFLSFTCSVHGHTHIGTHD